MSDDLDWLMLWYTSQCDEDWEHEFGVKIDTLDNPGWSLTVDLERTVLEGRSFTPIVEGCEDEEPLQGGDRDVPWLVCRVEGTKFKACGGPRDLARMIGAFRRWVAASAD